ncbi:DNA mismatch repair protein MutS, partial [bacterium]|nr:DNA mismatch repair protein MutS [bacterium]
AWSVAEYLHNNPKVAAKTLFATHYHELTELERLLPRVKNYNVAVKEWADNVVFLRKIVPGGCDNSYGIYVAKLAGLPKRVIERAKEILANLEANELTPSALPKIAVHHNTPSNNETQHSQLDLFNRQEQELRKKILAIDPNDLTPREALETLFELKTLVRQE